MTDTFGQGIALVIVTMVTLAAGLGWLYCQSRRPK